MRSHRLRGFLALCLGGMVPLASALGVNLVQNPSMESGFYSPTANPRDWVAIYTAEFDHAWVDGFAHLGRRCVRIDGAFNGSSDVRPYWDTSVSNPIPLDLDKVYLFRCWYRTEGVEDYSVLFRVRHLYRIPNTSIYRQAHTTNQYRAGSPDWQPVSFLIYPIKNEYPLIDPTLPGSATAEYVRISLGLDNSSGTVWFDDVYLGEVEPDELEAVTPEGNWTPPPIPTQGTPVQLLPTGYYSVQRAPDGVFHMVRPDGVAVWRTTIQDVNAVESVNPCHYNHVLATFPSLGDYRTFSRNRLQAANFNAGLNYPNSQSNIFSTGQILSLDFSNGPNTMTDPNTMALRNAQGTLIGYPGQRMADPYNPTWQSLVISRVNAVLDAATLRDPELAGYYTDNELPAWFLSEFIWSTYAEQEFLAWLRLRYGDDIAQLNAAWTSPYRTVNLSSFDQISTVKEQVIPLGFDDPVGTDLDLFARKLMRDYCTFTVGQIRRREREVFGDTGDGITPLVAHPVIANRFPAGGAPTFLESASRFFFEVIRDVNAERPGFYYDLLAVNDYPSQQLGRDHQSLRNTRYLQEIHEITGLPIIVSEFGVAARESEVGNSVKRWRNNTLDTQAQRGVAYRNMVHTWINLPFVVGAEWFMWENDYYNASATAFPCPPDPADPFYDGRNCGVVDDQDNPYTGLTNAMASVNLQVNQAVRRNLGGIDAIDWERSVAVPPPPMDFVRVDLVGTVAELAWLPSTASDIAGYNIYHSTDEDSGWTLLTPGGLASTETTYTHTALSDPEGPNFYRITAFDTSYNESAWTAPRPLDVPVAAERPLRYR